MRWKLLQGAAFLAALYWLLIKAPSLEPTSELYQHAPLNAVLVFAVLAAVLATFAVNILIALALWISGGERRPSFMFRARRAAGWLLRAPRRLALAGQVDCVQRLGGDQASPAAIGRQPR
jgi:hypothetical protein